MSKVKLTQEQAKIIEETKFALAGFSNEILVRCLNGEYEIEPSFKVGDWVFLDEFNKVAKVVDPYSTGGIRVDDNTFARFNNYRHATPKEIAEEKERRWWAKHGREPWELKTFDILHDGQHPYVITGIDHEYSRIELDGSGNFDLDGIEKRFKVACFVENRLDVKDDE